MLDINDKTVAEIVSQDYRTADAFKKNGIDFCCGGKVTLKEVCENKNISYEKLKADIETSTTRREEKHDFNHWPLDQLTDYISEKHHRYVRENIPIITQYAEKVTLVHGNGSPETVEIKDIFKALSQELLLHMHKEESILFPYIKKLSAMRRGEIPFTPPPFGSIQNPIRMMEIEHELAGDNERRIKELSNSYEPPAHACNTFRVLYAKLHEFESDLHKHIHLENNILFPRAIKLETKLTRN